MTRQEEYYFRLGQARGFAQAAGAVQSEIEEPQTSPAAAPALHALAYEFRQTARARLHRMRR